MKNLKCYFTFLFFLFITFGAFSQELNYRHYKDEDGNIVFVQKLSWQKFDDIECYRIELEELNKESKKAQILDKRLEENSIELNLPAGTYRYRISVYNVLGNFEKKSDWLEFEVLKATQPKIETLLDEELILKEEKVTTFELFGENLLQQSIYRIINNDKIIKGKILVADGNYAKIEFDLTGFKNETYEISVTNPGGLDTTKSFSIVAGGEEEEISTDSETQEENEEEEISTDSETQEENEEENEEEDSTDSETQEENEEEDSTDSETQEENEEEEEIPTDSETQEENEEEEDSTDSETQEENEEEDSTDSETQEENEEEDSTDSETQEENEEEDSTDSETQEENEEEDSTDSETQEENEEEDSTDSETQEENEEEDSTDSETQEENEEEEMSSEQNLNEVEEKEELPKENEQIKEPQEEVKKDKKSFKLPDMDFKVSLGMAFPYQIIGKEYYEGKFYKTFFGNDFLFPSFCGRFSVLPVKTKIGNFGIGALGGFTRVSYKNNRDVKPFELTGNMIYALALLVYQHDIGQRFTLDIHSGAGESIWNGFKYNYSNVKSSFSSDTLNVSSTLTDLGFAVQFTVFKDFYAEVGADFLYNINLQIGTIEPKIMFGIKF